MVHRSFRKSGPPAGMGIRARCALCGGTVVRDNTTTQSESNSQGVFLLPHDEGRTEEDEKRSKRWWLTFLYRNYEVKGVR